MYSKVYRRCIAILCNCVTTHHGQLQQQRRARRLAAGLPPGLRLLRRQASRFCYRAACEALRVQPLQGIPAAAHDVAHLRRRRNSRLT